MTLNKNCVTSNFGEPLLKKIRILLNAKGTCERIFKYFNANGNKKKKPHSGPLDPLQACIDRVI